MYRVSANPEVFDGIPDRTWLHDHRGAVLASTGVLDAGVVQQLVDSLGVVSSAGSLVGIVSGGRYAARR